MFIDYVGGVIVISMIPPDQASIIGLDLGTYGFHRGPEGDTNICKTDNVVELVNQVKRYFDYNKHPYSFSESIEAIIDEHNENVNAFNEFKLEADKIKNGDVNNEELSDFQSFLSTLPRTLRDHQFKSAFHLYRVGNGANFSVPGAGKTSVALSVYGKLRDEGKVNRLFVVGPTSCFYPWLDEFRLMLGRDPVHFILSGKLQETRKFWYEMPNNVELFLVSYQTLLNDVNMVKEMFNRSKNDFYFVMDEAHYIKRQDAAWANAVLQITNGAKNRCVLTGTPMPHSYRDLYNIFDAIWPDNPPIDSNTRMRIEALMSQNNDVGIQDILNETVGPLFYRVRKRDLGLGPQEFHPPIIVEMNMHERMIYDTIVKQIRDFARNEFSKEGVVWDRMKRGGITRLRQATSYPRLLETAITDFDSNIDISNSEVAGSIKGYDELEKPGKLVKLIEMVQGLQSEKKKVVIWTHFIGTLKMIEKELQELGLDVKCIYGDIPTEEMDGLESREQIRKQFIDPKSGIDILIANPGACAEAISLHKTCHNAIYYDLGYNCAQYLQSLDRIHRIGGSEDVTCNYYILQYAHSFEQRIIDNLEDKRDRMFALIEQEYPVYSIDITQGNDSFELELFDEIFEME
jgi:SNF2 family DNA or RNA helicase